MHFPTTAALTFALLTPIGFASDVVVSNFATPIGNGTPFGGGASTQYKAFGFTMEGRDYVLDEVILSLDAAGASPSASVEIWSDAGMIPSAPLFTLDDPAVLAGPGEYAFEASSEFVLQAGVSYWVYVRDDSMGGGSFTWHGTSPSTMPTGDGATGIGYEANGVPSAFFDRIEIRGTFDPGTNYCSANPNSTGATSRISATGSTNVALNDLTLTASDLPPLSFGFFLTSRMQGFVANPAGSQGNLCLSGAIGRYVGAGQIMNSGGSGSFALALDLTQTPQPNGFVSIAAGERWYFQAWHRDTVMGGATSNFTDGLELQF